MSNQKWASAMAGAVRTILKRMGVKHIHVTYKNDGEESCVEFPNQGVVIRREERIRKGIKGDFPMMHYVVYTLEVVESPDDLDVHEEEIHKGTHGNSAIVAALAKASERLIARLVKEETIRQLISSGSIDELRP